MMVLQGGYLKLSIGKCVYTYGVHFMYYVICVRLIGDIVWLTWYYGKGVFASAHLPITYHRRALC